jgi:hypothetical protein
LSDFPTSQDHSTPITHPGYLGGFYPRDTKGRNITEAWQGEKYLRNLPEEVATPMIRMMDGRILYIHELVQTEHQWFWPRGWVLGTNDDMFADGSDVVRTEVSFKSPMSVLLVLSNCIRWDSKLITQAVVCAEEPLSSRNPFPNFNVRYQIS